MYLSIKRKEFTKLNIAFGTLGMEGVLSLVTITPFIDKVSEGGGWCVHQPIRILSPFSRSSLEASSREFTTLVVLLTTSDHLYNLSLSLTLFVSTVNRFVLLL